MRCREAVLQYRQQLAADFGKERRGADAAQLNCAHDYNSLAIPAEVNNQHCGNQGTEENQESGCVEAGISVLTSRMGSSYTPEALESRHPPVLLLHAGGRFTENVLRERNPQHPLRF